MPDLLNPTSHASQHNSGGTDAISDASTTTKGIVELATSDENATSVVVQGNDKRLLGGVRPDYNWVTGEQVIIENDGFALNLSGLCTYYGEPYQFEVSSTATSTDGNYGVYTTGAISGNQKGYHITAFSLTVPDIRRKFYPQVYMKFQLQQTATTRFFVGFSDVAVARWTFPTGDDVLNAKSGFGLYVTSGGNFRIGRNDGTGATVFTSDLATLDTGIHTIYLEADDANSRWGYSFDNAAITYVTTEIPASTTPMFSYYYVETAAAAAKSFNLYHIKCAMRK